MKPVISSIAFLVLAFPVASGQEEKALENAAPPVAAPANAEDAPELAEGARAKHEEGSTKIADKQDELSADVQQLATEQTVPKVIELLNQVEAIMDEATDQLAAHDTGGKTLAAQTEIIEKIHEAAKEKQKQGGSSSGSAMMEMMERMMDKPSEGNQPQKGKDGQPGDQGGQGKTGLSDERNTMDNGATGGKSEIRKVPKAGGNTGHALPEEFQKALDAYNRGAEKKVK